VRVGFIRKDSQLISRRVILGNLFEYLSEYVETVPIPVSRFPASLFEYHGLVDGDCLVRDLLSLLPLLEELELDYFYPLASLAPYFFFARELSKARISFLMSVPCVSPDMWFLHWLLVAPLLRPGDVLMIPNVTAREALKRISPVYESQPALIPRSIDLQRVDREVVESPPDLTSETLVYLGRLDESKNVHLLVEAMPDVLRAVPGGRLRLLVPIRSRGGGNLSLHYYQRIKKSCQRLLLEDRVDFIEPASEGDKYRYLVDSAAVVFLSLFSGELFGYAVLEALSCGSPVVCTAWSGYRELVADGYNGFLIPAFWQGNTVCLDEEILRRTLITVLTSGVEQREEMRERARASVTEYDYRRVMPRLVSNFIARESAGDTYPGRRPPRWLFEPLLGQPIGRTRDVWADSLLSQFEELASLRYGAIAGMQCSRAESMRVSMLLRTFGAELGRYLNGHYVSDQGRFCFPPGTAVRPVGKSVPSLALG
jgi:glycosyltransferase involved in cell wall biosynthesis